MADDRTLVENELNDHKIELNEWVAGAKSFNAPDSHKRVLERFIRDCETLKTDMEKDSVVSSVDLCDFTDRKNSLEIQYINLKQDLT